MDRITGHIAGCCLRGIAVLAASACLAVSCIFEKGACPDETAPAGNTYVTLAIDTGHGGTKAETGRAAVDDTESGVADESVIHSVRVWAFSSASVSSSAYPLGYTEAEFDGDDVTGTGSVGGLGAGAADGFKPGQVLADGLRAVSVRIPDSGIDAIDVYVMVNAESGCSLLKDGRLVRGGNAVSGIQLTRGELESSLYSGMFGVNADGTPAVTSVPGTGLPMSGCVKGLAIEAYKAEIGKDVPGLIDVPVVRSVSKLQFFFAKKDGVDGLADFRIDSIDMAEAVGDGMGMKGVFMPGAENVFSDGKTVSVPSGADYSVPLVYRGRGTSSMLLHSSGMKAVADPLVYSRGAYEDAEAYMARLRGAGLTTNGCAYFYETGNRIRGIISCRRSAADAVKRIKFELAPGDFLRNRENIIYVYVLEGKVVVKTDLKYQVVDWEGNFSADIKFD